MLPKRLRAARVAAGLSTRELSRLAGLSEVTCSHIETGRIESPSVASVDALARVLGCSLSWLVRGDGEMPAPANIAYYVALARRRHSRKARAA